MAKVVIAGKTFHVRRQQDQYGTDCVILEHSTNVLETYEHESAEDAENTYNTILVVLSTVARIVGNAD